MDQLLKQEMTQLKEEVSDIKDTVGDIKAALMGNAFAKDGGLVGRIIRLETELEGLQEEFEKQKEKQAKSDVQVKIMWALVGAFATGTVGFILTQIFNR